MASRLSLLVLLAFAAAAVQARYFYEEEPLLYDSFPSDFVWACATSSYQIEGAWNVDGKGESIWDRFAHDPNNIADGSNGDVACDSYNQYGRDIEMLVDLGVTHYRFSIAWARILPEGTGTINQAGIDWYSAFVDALLDAGIKPMVTLYHWDLPQVLEDQGGWLNDDISDWFLAYADVMFNALGDRVDFWITFNEPWVFAVNGYGAGVHAPGLDNIAEYPYIVGHNVLRAHAKAYRLYKDNYAEQGGQIGITLNVGYGIADNDDPATIAAVERGLQFNFGWFAHPILIGDYPPVMRDLIDYKSEQQGFPQSRLPYFTADEITALLGSSDFLGVNYYTGSVVGEVINDPNSCVSFWCDSDTYSYHDDSWFGSGSDWLKVSPFSLRMMLNWIKDEYNNIPVYITENGFSDRAGNVDDLQRVYYYKHYINNVLKAIRTDGCNVAGYTAWSLMDNFEWAMGYVEKFGIHAVDFNDPARPRTQKTSALWYKQLIERNGFIDDDNCVLN